MASTITMPALRSVMVLNPATPPTSTNPRRSTCGTSCTPVDGSAPPPGVMIHGLPYCSKLSMSPQAPRTWWQTAAGRWPIQPGMVLLSSQHSPLLCGVRSLLLVIHLYRVRIDYREKLAISLYSPDVCKLTELRWTWHSCIVISHITWLSLGDLDIHV